MVVDIYYNARSHPSGYTDDLGIMSDKNQWVDALYVGWYASFGFNHGERDEFISFCNEAKIDLWQMKDGKFMIMNSEAIPLLMLRYGNG